MHGQRQHRAAGGGGCAVGRQRTEVDEQLAGGLQRLRRGWIDERQRFGRGVPHGQFQGESAEVDLGDLGRQVGEAGRLFELAPQPVAGARLGAAGAASALVGRGPAGGHGGEPGHAGAGIEPGHPCQTGIDHHAHAGDGERRLGDVGAQHHTTSAGGRRGERQILVGQRQCTGQRVHVDRGRHPVAQQTLNPADLADAGQEHQHVALFVAQRGEHGLGGGLLDAHALAGGQRADVDRVFTAFAGHDRRRGGATEQRGDAAGVGCGRHGQQPQVGPQVGAHVEGQSQTQVGGQVAFVHLVEDHRCHTGQVGVVLQAAGEHPFGHHLDAGGWADAPLVAGLVAHCAAHLFAEQRCHAPGCGTGGESARFEHHDAAVAEPGLVEQPQRHDRGLARARGRHDDRLVAVDEGLPERVEHAHDGQIGDGVGNRHQPACRCSDCAVVSWPGRACRGTGPGRRPSA